MNRNKISPPWTDPIGCLVESNERLPQSLVYESGDTKAKHAKCKIKQRGLKDHRQMVWWDS